MNSGVFFKGRVLRRRLYYYALPFLMFVPALPGFAAADGGIDTINVVGSADRNSVANLAATQSSLDTLQPETVLNEHFIRDVASPVSDYLAIVEFSPSASNSTPNGAGLSSKNGTVRGFQDGQYNVTFDGIPFGDPSAFGHATTSFFPGPALSRVEVDRGPGTAGTVGNATFGGTVALSSETPADAVSGKAFAAAGSGATYQAGGTANTGAISETGGTKAFVNYSHAQSDGLLDDAGFGQENVIAKIVQPLGENTELTVVGDVDKLKWNTYSQPIFAATAKYGLSYANLNNDPTSQSYAGYNVDHRQADFDYVELKTALGGLNIDNNAYTYSLDDTGFQGAQTNGTVPNIYLYANGDVPGNRVHSNYRAWGDIVRADEEVGSGLFDTDIRTGLWYEHARYRQFADLYDLTAGKEAAYNGLAGRYTSPIAYDTLAESQTVQPYVELEWKPLPGLSVVPGFKYADFSRTMTGPYLVSASQLVQLGSDVHYGADLGSVAVNYRILPELSYYAQWAMGFQAPQASYFQTASAQYNRLSPQQTINYQSGLVWKDDRWAADIDGYFINFRNYINSTTAPVGPGGVTETIYQNFGGVYYKGIEAEATYLIGWGLSVMANGSVNNAAHKGLDTQIANTPTKTAAFGLIYEGDGPFGSILTKYVGHRYAGGGQNTSPNDYLPSYTFTDLNAGYKLGTRLKIEFSVSNLFDNRTVTEGSGAATNPTYYYMPGRSYMGQVSAGF